jgi:NAD(P)-dependent dehydrogenase (short-subunit alcohol dehydrogenase family)
MSRFAGKVAFVTGATTGIGRATALAFAREGASLVIAGIPAGGNQETARADFVKPMRPCLVAAYAGGDGRAVRACD